MHKIKPGTLTAGTVKHNFKVTVQGFVAKGNAFSFMISIRKTPTHWKQLL